MSTASEYGCEKISVAMARATPSRLPERLSVDNRAAALTRHGKPILAVMPWDLFESIVEAMEIIGDPETMAAWREGVQDVLEGNLVPLEQVKAELG